MKLSPNVTNKIVNIMKQDSSRTTTSSSAPVFGTIVAQGGKTYVRLDGSDCLTPMVSAADVEEGDRVLVNILRHSATIIGNVSSPSASSTKVTKIEKKVDDNGNSIVQINNTINQQGNTITQLGNEINQQNNTITQLGNEINQQNNTITQLGNEINQQGNDITQINDTIKSQNNQITQINNTINEHGNSIELINTTLTTHGSDIKSINDKITTANNNITAQGNSITLINTELKSQKSSIETINSTLTSQKSSIETINSTLTTHDSTIKVINSSFEITNGVVTGIKGVDTDWIKVKDLEANSAKIEDLDAKKANIDLANVNNAWIENGMIIDGSIGTAAISEGAITNAKIADATIESAKIKSINADTITAGTLKTERLIITSEDGTESIVKAINIANGVPEAEVNSDKIQAASVDVADLSAFEATIANFKLSGNAMYSGKTSIKDSTSGIYISTTGVGIGNGALTGRNESPVQVYADGSFKLLGKNSSLDFNTVTGNMDLNVTTLKIGSKTVATTEDLEAAANDSTAVVKVSSSKGTQFRDPDTTTLTVTVYKGKNSATTKSELASLIGEDAYLQWYRKLNDGEFVKMESSNSAISDDGFTLTAKPNSPHYSIAYKCDLVDTPYDVLILDTGILDQGVLS